MKDKYLAELFLARELRIIYIDPEDEDEFCDLLNDVDIIYTREDVAPLCQVRYINRE